MLLQPACCATDAPAGRADAHVDAKLHEVVVEEAALPARLPRAQEEDVGLGGACSVCAVYVPQCMCRSVCAAVYVPQCMCKVYARRECRLR